MYMRPRKGVRFPARGVTCQGEPSKAPLWFTRLDRVNGGTLACHTLNRPRLGPGTVDRARYFKALRRRAGTGAKPAGRAEGRPGPAGDRVRAQLRLRVLRAGADSQNHDALGLDPVADDVGPNHDQLAPLAARRPCPLGEIRKAFGRGDEARSETSGSRRIKLPDVIADAAQIARRLRRPDYSPHFGGGNSPGVPHDRSQRRMALCEMNLPAAISASASANAFSSAASSAGSKTETSGADLLMGLT